MYNILKKSILLLGIVALVSCDDYLDEEPVNSTTRDKFFASETALETYANGFLNSYLPSAATLTYGDQISDIAVAKQTDGYLRAGQYNASQATNWAEATGVNSTMSTITLNTCNRPKARFRKPYTIIM